MDQLRYYISAEVNPILYLYWHCRSPGLTKVFGPRCLSPTDQWVSSMGKTINPTVISCKGSKRELALRNWLKSKNAMGGDGWVREYRLFEAKM